MGTKAKEIIGIDREELLKLLNKAYADEWLAYYQYWVGAKVATGRMRGIIAEELEEHAKEELEHASKLTERILQLGGTPLTTVDAWSKETNCGYDEPADPDTRKLLEQNIKGEQCAIEVYNELLKKTKDTDPVTYKMVLEILEDEIEHEDDLESILEDMK
jgi:bacterioferritin